MSDEIKMSDIFDLPVRSNQLEVYGANTNGNISFDEIENAAAFAINSHDRLVEENKRLREALERIQGMQARTPELAEDYTHEDVGDLSDRIDDVFGIVNTALKLN